MSSQNNNKSAVDVLRDNASSINLFSQKLFLFAILELASRLAALERTVKDYKEAVDAITAWADGRDREAYEKAIKEIPDEPDRAEIVERYIIQLRVLDPKSSGWKAMAVATLNALIDEVTK